MRLSLLLEKKSLYLNMFDRLFYWIISHKFESIIIIFFLLIVAICNIIFTSYKNSSNKKSQLQIERIESIIIAVLLIVVSIMICMYMEFHVRIPAVAIIYNKLLSMIVWIITWITNNKLLSISICLGVITGIGSHVILHMNQENIERRRKIESRYLIPCVILRIISFGFIIVRGMFKAYIELDSWYILLIATPLLLILYIFLFVLAMLRIFLVQKGTLRYEEDEIYRNKVDAGLFFIFQTYHQYFRPFYRKYLSYTHSQWAEGKKILLIIISAFIGSILIAMYPKFFFTMYWLLFISLINFRLNLKRVAEHNQKSLVEVDEAILFKIRCYLQKFWFVGRFFPLILIAMYVSEQSTVLAVGPTEGIKGIRGMIKALWHGPEGKSIVATGIVGTGVYLTVVGKIIVESYFQDQFDIKHTHRMDELAENDVQRKIRLSEHDFKQKSKILDRVDKSEEAKHARELAIIDRQEQAAEAQHAREEQAKRDDDARKLAIAEAQHAREEQAKRDDHARKLEIIEANKWKLPWRSGGNNTGSSTSTGSSSSPSSPSTGEKSSSSPSTGEKSSSSSSTGEKSSSSSSTGEKK
jgi:hypothetical protein